MAQVTEVKYSAAAKNFIKRADAKLKQVIRTAIDELKVLPPIGDIKPMQGYRDGRMRKRIGKYRIIFRYDENDNLIVLYVLDVGSRGDIYK